MSEHSVAQARASVMLYDNERKQWQPSGGSQGLSRVNVYHHPVNNTFRIVGRKVNDHAVVINCALARGLKYNEATPTFHQWRDQRQVYGLNFQSRDDAEVFGHAVREALETLKESPANAASAAAPQSYHQRDQYYQESVSNGPAGGQEDMAAHMRQRQAAADYDSHDNYSRSRVATGGSQDRQYRPQYDSQGSGGGSETESPSSSQLSVASSVGPTSPTQSAAPPAPTPPPAPPAPSAPAPPQPPPVPSAGAPAPPPPPPAPPAPSAGGGGSLADQIAAAKLRKSSKGDSGDGGIRPERSGSVRGNNSGVGGMDMMAEMQRKLAARRAKQDDKPSTNGPGPGPAPVNQEERSFPPGRSVTPSNPPAFSSNTNKTNFAAPAKMNKSESRFNSTSTSSKSDSNISSEQLEEFKSELIMAFRQELESYKEEIVEAVRREISKTM